MNLKPFLNKKVLIATSLLAGGGIAALVSFKKNNNDSVPPIENAELPNKQIASGNRGPSISSILANKNIKLLGSLNTDFKKWEVIKAKYDKTAPSMNLVITLDGEDLPKLTNLNIEELSKWCSEKSSGNFQSEEDKVFKQVKEFCSTPKNRDYLNNIGKTIIPSNNSVSWGTAVQKYTEERKTRRITIKELGSNEVDPNLLQKWCENNIDKEYEEEKFNWLSNFCTE